VLAFFIFLLASSGIRRPILKNPAQPFAFVLQKHMPEVPMRRIIALLLLEKRARPGTESGTPKIYPEKRGKLRKKSGTKWRCIENRAASSFARLV